MKIIMLGTGDFAVPTFQTLLSGTHPVVLLVTQPDRPQGRKQQLVRAEIKKLAEKRSVPVFQPDNVNAAAAVDQLRGYEPDLFVVAAYGQILSRELLEVAPAINLHASLLPKYRGAAPINWAIYHGETRTGVTVIQINPRLDAGAILLKRETEIGAEETAGALESRLAEIGAEAVAEALDQLERGTARPIPQDDASATKAPKLTKENGLLDWSRTGQQVYDQIRAFTPWPQPFSYLLRPDLDPLRIIVKRASVQKQTKPQRDPGEIIEAADHGIDVQCGAGVLRILSVKPAGKRAMDVAEFLRGKPLASGGRFGSPPPPRPDATKTPLRKGLGQ